MDNASDLAEKANGIGRGKLGHMQNLISLSDNKSSALIGTPSFVGALVGGLIAVARPPVAVAVMAGLATVMFVLALLGTMQSLVPQTGPPRREDWRYVKTELEEEAAHPAKELERTAKELAGCNAASNRKFRWNRLSLRLAQLGLVFLLLAPLGYLV